MNSDKKDSTPRKDLFDELVLKISADTYVDDLGECLEQKKRELANNNDYAIPTKSFQEFNNYYRKKIGKSSTLRFFSHPKKVACFLAITLIAFASNINSVEAFRIKILDFFIEQKETFTTIQLKSHRDSSLSKPPKEWNSFYYPKYIPIEFKLVESNKYSSFGELIYTNNNGDEIAFTFDSGNTSLTIDTEDAIITEVLIKNIPAQMVSKKGYTTILLEYEGILFTVSGPISKRSLTEIAESIEK